MAGGLPEGEPGFHLVALVALLVDQPPGHQHGSHNPARNGRGQAVQCPRSLPLYDDVEEPEHQVLTPLPILHHLQLSHGYQI